MLFARTTRSTRLTRAGKLFLEHVRRVLAAVEQARESVRLRPTAFTGSCAWRCPMASRHRVYLPCSYFVARKNLVEIRFFEVPCHSRSKGFIAICTTWDSPSQRGW